MSSERSYKIKRPTLNEKVYSADIIIFLDHIHGIDIYKNRYGQHGKNTTEELVEILSLILTEHLFNGRLKLFQAGMQTKIKTAINKVIERGKYDTI